MPAKCAHLQVKLTKDLAQLTPEQFDRGIEVLVLARDEALDKHPEGIEEYDLYLNNLDAPAQQGLQAYADACLRPRFQTHPHLWPGFVVGSGAFHHAGTIS